MSWKLKEYCINNIYAVVEKRCYVAQKSVEINTIPTLATPRAESVSRCGACNSPFLCVLPGRLLLLPHSHRLFFFFLIFIYLFIYFWLCWVFASVRGLSLVVASGGHSSSWCTGLSLSRALLLRSTGSRCAASVVVAHGPSCSAACGIFPDQGSNPCPLH